VDDIGHQGWPDTTDTICFVSCDIEDQLISYYSYPVSRPGKRISLTDGGYVRPCSIIQRKTFDNEFLVQGFTPEKIEICSQSHPFVDIEIFNRWFRGIFLPHLLGRRSQLGYRGPTHPIANNVSAHRGLGFDALCQSHHVVPIWLSPHSSNQLQMLDLCMFGVMKRFINCANHPDKVNIQTIHIVSIPESFLSAAVPHNIVAGFGNAGVSLLMDEDRITRCNVTPDTGDVSLDSHSSRDCWCHCLMRRKRTSDRNGAREKQDIRGHRQLRSKLLRDHLRFGTGRYEKAVICELAEARNQNRN
jgi:hypothetical protein